MKYFCENCGTLLKSTKNSKNKFCSAFCQKEKEYKEYIERWLLGNEKGWISQTRQLSGHIKRFMKQQFGTACQECGWDQKHPADGKHLTEIDHVDGDAENCCLNNLRILCPNCHSMTPTFRARNKKSKRKR